MIARTAVANIIPPVPATRSRLAYGFCGGVYSASFWNDSQMVS